MEENSKPVEAASTRAPGMMSTASILVAMSESHAGQSQLSTGQSGYSQPIGGHESYPLRNSDNSVHPQLAGAHPGYSQQSGGQTSYPQQQSGGHPGYSQQSGSQSNQQVVGHESYPMRNSDNSVHPQLAGAHPGYSQQSGGQTSYPQQQSGGHTGYSQQSGSQSNQQMVGHESYPMRNSDMTMSESHPREPLTNVYPACGPLTNMYPARGPLTNVYPARGPLTNVYPARGPLTNVYPARGPLTNVYTARGPLTNVYPSRGPPPVPSVFPTRVMLSGMFPTRVMLTNNGVPLTDKDSPAAKWAKMNTQGARMAYTNYPQQIGNHPINPQQLGNHPINPQQLGSQSGQIQQIIKQVGQFHQMGNHPGHLQQMRCNNTGQIQQIRGQTGQLQQIGNHPINPQQTGIRFINPQQIGNHPINPQQLGGQSGQIQQIIKQVGQIHQMGNHAGHFQQVRCNNTGQIQQIRGQTGQLQQIGNQSITPQQNVVFPTRIANTSMLPPAVTTMTTVTITEKEVQLPVVKWSKINAQAAKMCYPPHARHGHKAIAYKNVMIVFSGGNEGLFKDLNVYNTNTNEWFQPVCKGDVPSPRAAYGAVIDGGRILIYGGMEENCCFTDSLYELNISRWEWSRLSPRPRTSMERPCARIGHSFTLIKDKIYMFGGLTNLVIDNIYADCQPSYLKELHILLIRQNMQHGVWEVPVAFGTPPSPRESHSAVAYVSKDSRHNKLVIFGGMFGNRLGDLFTLDVDTMMWSNIKTDQRAFPLPRSLHSASVVGDKMYVFGGWVQMSSKEMASNMGGRYECYDLPASWRCDNTVSCLNLKTMTWEKVTLMDSNDGSKLVPVPPPRAGHSAAVINNKIYIWSGRDGYNKHHHQGSKAVKQVCHYDFWKLEVSRPAAPDKVKLVQAFPHSVIVGWDPVPGADGYILQCMNVAMPNVSLYY